jgi:hypothetical protein
VSICSILIPSRARPAGLWRAVRAAQATAKLGAPEILARLDDDDDATLAIASALEADGVRVVVGPRLKGYLSLSGFYDELAAIATSPWIWIGNDDAYIDGHGWDEQLAATPTNGFIVQPELYRWNTSGYQWCEGGAFPAVPNQSWRLFGHEAIGTPIDTWFDVVLRRQNGWKTHFLKGVTAVHLRDTETQLVEHRKINGVLPT